MVLLLNSIMPTVPVFADDPEPEETLVWDYVHDEDSWNAAYNKVNSRLKAYYKDYPDEDVYCGSSVATFGDRIWVGSIS